MQSFITVPFRTETGFSQIEGIGKFSPAGIVLEFESKFLGFIKSGVRENRIALDELLDCRFRRGFLKFGAKIEIRLKSLQRLSELPSHEGKIGLKIGRDDFELAREAVELINRSMTARREELPPAHTPVSVLFDESESETQELPEKKR